MSAAVFHNEMRLMLRAPTLTAAVLLFVVLAAAAGFAGGERVRAAGRAADAALQAEAQAFARYRGQAEAARRDGVVRQDADGVWRLAPGQAFGDAYEGADAGSIGLRRLSRTAVLKPEPLAAFSLGVADLRPQALAVSARPAHQVFQAPPEIDNPAAQGVGPFDLTFVFIFFLPLLVLALAYDLLARDRESGVEALSLAQGVRRRDYVAAKLAARAVWTAAATAVAGLGALIAAGAAASGAAWAALAAWTGVALAYGGFWLALALGANLIFRNASAAAAALAGAWLVLIAVAPPTVRVVSETLYPPPSRLALTAAVRAASADAEREAAAALNAFLFDHPDQARTADKGDFYLMRMARESAVERAVAPAFAAFDAARARRRALAQRLMWLSPALPAQEAFDRIAGTDPGRHDAFLSGARREHAAWRGWFEDRIVAGAALTPEDYDTLARR